MLSGLVYINWGRVIVECPYGCNNAYLYKANQTRRLCDGPGGCNYEFELVVPNNLNELYAELSKRPQAENRNWFPEGHPLAVRSGKAMGQSVADLAAEFELGREGKIT